MPIMKNGRHARHEIKAARPRWLTLLVALGLFVALMPMSAAFAEGQHSPAECDALETTDADVATAPDGYIIDAICIKSGDDAFDDYASLEGPKHSILITADGTYDGYDVSGIGTSQVTVDDSGAAHGLSHIDYRLVEDDQLELQVDKVWAGDEIDLAGVTVDFTIKVGNGAAVPGAGPVDVEEGDTVVITEEASGLPDNCTYESNLDDVSPYIVDAEDAVDGLITRTVTNTVDCVNVPQGLLTVDKTAEATFDRDHDWSILKSVDPAVVNLFTDGSGDASVTWDIDVTYDGFADTGHEVTGTITITNDEPLFDAGIDSVIDDLGGEVDCDFPDPVTDLPVTLDADGGELVCDYSLTGVTEDGTNTVSVTGELIDVEDADNVYPIDKTDSAEFSFVLDEETDETVVVSDLSDLGDLLSDAYTVDQLTLDAADYVAGDVEPFNYSMDFAYETWQEVCGEYTLRQHRHDHG